jgi:hypothetical protein
MSSGLLENLEKCKEIQEQNSVYYSNGIPSTEQQYKRGLYSMLSGKTVCLFLLFFSTLSSLNFILIRLEF